MLSSCWVDPHQCANHCGDYHGLLLHGGTAATDLDSLPHPGLEVADPHRVLALLRLLPLFMVRQHGQHGLSKVGPRWVCHRRTLPQVVPRVLQVARPEEQTRARNQEPPECGPVQRAPRRGWKNRQDGRETAACLCVTASIVWHDNALTTACSLCTDAARVYEKRAVWVAGFPLRPGPVPHHHNEEHDPVSNGRMVCFQSLVLKNWRCNFDCLSVTLQCVCACFF